MKNLFNMNEDQVKKLIEQQLTEFWQKQYSVIEQTDIVPRTIKPRHIETVFGSMYATNASITITVAASDTAYEVTSGLTSGGQLDGISFGDSHYLETNYGGKFLIVWSMAIETGTANQDIEGGIMVNGTAIEIGTGHTSSATANKAHTIAGSLIQDLSANDQVSLYVRNQTLATDILVEHANLTLCRVGR